MSEKRTYPLVLEAYLLWLGPKTLTNTKIVYNETEYNSFVHFHLSDPKNKYELKERRPTWKELKGQWIGLRAWNAAPKWLVAAITYVMGWLTLDKLLSLFSKLLQ